MYFGFQSAFVPADNYLIPAQQQADDSFMPFKMRPLLIILAGFFLTVHGFSQQLKLPKNPYVLKIGKYKFVSKTVIERNPDLSGGFASSNFGGLQLEMPASDSSEVDDSTDTGPVYLNGDSLRLWTYLFKEDTVAIKFPRKIDTVRVMDMNSNKVRIRHDTTDQILVNRIVDTINVEQLKKLLTTEIEVYNGTKKMKLRTISVMLLWSNGKRFYTNYDKKRIADYPKMTQRALTLSPGGYLILDMFWYYNLENDQDGMEGSIAWKIK